MSAAGEEYTKYLNDNGVLPRLQEILQQLIEMDPLPVDPLLEILQAIGCPLIPQAQMKALERKVSRAQDELRYLRRVLIDLGRKDALYDSETDEDEYVGQVGEIKSAPASVRLRGSMVHQKSITQSSTQYILDASITIKKDPQNAYGDEKPCCSRSIQGNLKQS